MIARKTIAAGLLAVAAFTMAAPAGAASRSIAADATIQLVRDSRPQDRPRQEDGSWRHRDGHYGGWHKGWYRTLSAQEVRRILRNHGFHDIRYVDRRGAVYQARAVDYRGRYQGLVINARNGAILAKYRIR